MTPRRSAAVLTATHADLGPCATPRVAGDPRLAVGSRLSHASATLSAVPHRTEAAILDLAHRQRDNAAALARWRVLRFTWQVVARRPEVVQAQVATALAAVAA